MNIEKHYTIKCIYLSNGKVKTCVRTALGYKDRDRIANRMKYQLNWQVITLYRIHINSNGDVIEKPIKCIERRRYDK